MREIKFRGYSEKYKSWFYGFLVTNAKGHYQIKHTLENGNTAVTTVKEKSIGQYTNLKDKNGKEIYEGDIVQTPFTIDDGEYENHVVIYDRGCFCIDYSIDYHPLLNETNEFCKVIYNIYNDQKYFKGG